MIMFYLVLSAIPIAMVAVAFFVMYDALREPAAIGWWRMGISVCMLGVLAALVYSARWLGYGFAGVIAASLLGSYVVTTVGAIWMVVTLPRWRKLAALIVGLCFPLATQVSAFFVLAVPREHAMRCEVRAAAAQVEAYHRDHNVYPARLLDIDTYLRNAPEACIRSPSTIGHLMYSRTTTAYVLANWAFVDSSSRWMGPLVCLYDPASQTPSCHFNTWGAFNPSYYETYQGPLLRSP